jgi:hypothetical protein
MRDDIARLRNAGIVSANAVREAFELVESYAQTQNSS